MHIQISMADMDKRISMYEITHFTLLLSQSFAHTLARSLCPHTFPSPIVDESPKENRMFLPIEIVKQNKT